MALAFRGRVVLSLTAAAVVATSLLFDVGVQVANTQPYATPIRLQFGGKASLGATEADNNLQSGASTQTSSGTSGTVTQPQDLAAAPATQSASGTSGTVSQPDQSPQSGAATQTSSGTSGTVTQPQDLASTAAIQGATGTSGTVEQVHMPTDYHLHGGHAPVLEIATDHHQAGVILQTAAAPVLRIVTRDQCCEC